MNRTKFLHINGERLFPNYRVTEVRKTFLFFQTNKALLF